ncbi:MAG: hypothetical protein QGI83_16310 [Candidatus Latescibacteria bacterium]|jgi:hypothetical protein|nr:hypothetical protein [Candidatus Latescibacterota bacterium]
MRWLIVLLVFLTVATEAPAQQIRPPGEVEAFDTPNDAGKSITVTWRRSDAVPSGARYRIVVGESPHGPFHIAAEVGASGSLKSGAPAIFGHNAENSEYHFTHITVYTIAGEEAKTDSLEDHQPYYVRVDVVTETDVVVGEAIEEASAHGNLFNGAKLNNFILAVVFSAIILIYIGVARRRDLHIRRIAGLEALDEALGRATEMGKPVLFAHGLHGMESVSTIAAVNILSRVARRTAEYDSTLRVVNYDPVVMAVSQEVVKESYLDAGRPDAFDPDCIFLAATEQFSYAAAVEGIMVRERPAANILMGYFYAESLLLAETGAATGAIQIAGTDSYTQLPFFVTTCDYTLMGEELYAASAYLSREPRLLGSLKGQDVGKAVLIIVLVLGTLLATLGQPALTHIFTSY